MPTSGRGGKRNGKPGTAYPNRSDLNQAPRAVPNQPYGVAGQQLQAQQQMPLPAQPQNPAAQPAPQPAGPTPGQLGPLTAPTDRPNEPVTAGIPQGAGPGPEALGAPPLEVDPTVGLLKGLLSAYPNPDLQALLTQAMRNSPR